MTTDERPDEKVALTVAEFAARFGISRQTVTRDVASGRIRSVRFGRLVRIPVTEVDRLLAESSAAGSLGEERPAAG